MDCTASRQAAAPEILQATAAAMSRLVERGPGGDPHAYICALATALGALAPTSRATLPLISALRGIGTAGLATALQRAVAAVWSLMDAAANRETRALTAALQGRLLSLLAALCERCSKRCAQCCHIARRSVLAWGPGTRGVLDTGSWRFSNCCCSTARHSFGAPAFSRQLAAAPSGCGARASSKQPHSSHPAFRGLPQSGRQPEGHH